MEKLKALFHRNFETVHGGHVVFRQLFGFLELEPGIEPYVGFSTQSVWNTSNLWYNRPDRRVSQWNPNEADLLILGGIDWEAIPLALAEAGTIPTIHVVTAHYFAEPGHFSYDFLRYPAVRVALCSSIHSTLIDCGCRGPVYSWTEAVDFDPQTLLVEEKVIDWLIVGYKNPETALKIASRMKNSPLFADKNIEILTRNIPRDEYLKILSKSKCSLLLPYKEEGYYRAAIEAMALEVLVVTADLKGPRDWTKHRENGLFVPYTEEELFLAVCDAEKMLLTDKLRLIANGILTSQRQSYEESRKSFISIVNETLTHWNEPGFIPRTANLTATFA